MFFMFGIIIGAQIEKIESKKVLNECMELFNK